VSLPVAGNGRSSRDEARRCKRFDILGKLVRDRAPVVSADEHQQGLQRFLRSFLGDRVRVSASQCVDIEAFEHMGRKSPLLR
jgi:hypothetical protein